MKTILTGTGNFQSFFQQAFAVSPDDKGPH
jgi:hypothetical protein